MSVIVMGMEMPKKAMFAVIFPPDDEHDYCYIRVVEGKGKGGDYEIIPLPEKHGRLIDADALDETFSRLNDDGWQLTQGDHKRMESVLFEIPTIVEAEGENDE